MTKTLPLNPSRADTMHPNAQAEHWSVIVEVNGESILTISSQHVSGVTDIDRHATTIRNCADHLVAFIGNPAPEVDQWADYHERCDHGVRWEHWCNGCAIRNVEAYRVARRQEAADVEYESWTGTNEKKPPYPFCLTPAQCAGQGQCPRDPCCAE